MQIESIIIKDLSHIKMKDGGSISKIRGNCIISEKEKDILINFIALDFENSSDKNSSIYLTSMYPILIAKEDGAIFRTCEYCYNFDWKSHVISAIELFFDTSCKYKI